MRSVLVLALVCTWPLCWATLPASQTDRRDESFQSFLRTWEDAQTRFINGDAALWKQHASQRDDVTILGGFGGAGEKGWKAVGPRYDWAASRYGAGKATVRVEYLNVLVSGDLALTVAVERQHDVQVGTHREPIRRALRATQIFRKEGTAWKLVHRHADQLTEKQAPPQVPARE